MSHHRLTAVLAVTALATVVTGCTSILPGTPKPEAGPGSGTPAPGASCARSANPAVCLEWEDTKPKTGEALIEQANQDPAVAAQMLCSALPSSRWDQWLGTGHYRVIAQGPACTISSDDTRKSADGTYEPVIEVEIVLSPKETLARDLSLLRSRQDTAAMVTELTIAGKPVMRVGTPDDANGQGREKEELSVAPLGDVNKAGALRIRQSMRPPRGRPVDTAVDRSKLDAMRDPMVTELLKVLFP
jgi:hypothetical protein